MILIVIKTMVIALGGNALIKEKQRGTLAQQLQNIEHTAEHIAELICEGHKIVLTHGNGPQVGALLLKQEAAKDVPPMPLDVCVAASQGEIGFLLQRVFQHRLKRPIVTVITQVLVDEKDPAFKKPSKPIGPFYTEAQEKKLQKKYSMAEDAGRGYRRVVPSPKPLKIFELAAIKTLLESSVVIACGGGGIPVIRRGKSIRGVEAVIDKDYVSALLAKELDADLLAILTNVDQVALNFGKKNEEWLRELSVADAKKYLKQNQFSEGSMKPKIEAAVQFIESGGEGVVITSLDKLRDAMKGKAGTWVVK